MNLSHIHLAVQSAPPKEQALVIRQIIAFGDISDFLVWSSEGWKLHWRPQPLKQAASSSLTASLTALNNNMTNDGKSANGCRPTTRSPRGQNKGIMGRQFVYLERAGRQSLQGQTKKWRHISNLANSNLPHSIQAFLDFCGFDFRNFRFTLFYNSIIFSSPLVPLRNLDCRGFCICGLFSVSPH